MKKIIERRGEERKGEETGNQRKQGEGRSEKKRGRINTGKYRIMDKISI